MQKKTREFYWDWNDEEHLSTCNNLDCPYIDEHVLCTFPEPLPRDKITNLCIPGSTIHEIEKKEKEDSK